MTTGDKPNAPPRNGQEDREGRRQTSSAARTRILDRLTSAYEPGTVPESPVSHVAYKERPDKNSGEELLALLLKRFADAQVGHHLLSSPSELLDSLANNIYTAKAKTVAVAGGNLFADIGLAQGLVERLPGVAVVTVGPDDWAAVEADVGVTDCLGLVAQTGTIALSSRARGPLSVSLLPGIHYCVATEDQLYADVEQCLESGRLDVAENQVFVSGPSRTADIENQVVIGVHGPWRLSVFLVRE